MEQLPGQTQINFDQPDDEPDTWFSSNAKPEEFIWRAEDGSVDIKEIDFIPCSEEERIALKKKGLIDVLEDYGRAHQLFEESSEDSAQNVVRRARFNFDHIRENYFNENDYRISSLDFIENHDDYREIMQTIIEESKGDIDFRALVSEILDMIREDDEKKKEEGWAQVRKTEAEKAAEQDIENAEKMAKIKENIGKREEQRLGDIRSRAQVTRGERTFADRTSVAANDNTYF
jgi:hypothetical protein